MSRDDGKSFGSRGNESGAQHRELGTFCIDSGMPQCRCRLRAREGVGRGQGERSVVPTYTFADAQRCRGTDGDTERCEQGDGDDVRPGRDAQRMHGLGVEVVERDGANDGGGQSGEPIDERSTNDDRREDEGHVRDLQGVANRRRRQGDEKGDDGKKNCGS